MVEVYGKRTMVAVEPLLMSVRRLMPKREREFATYIAARAMTDATTTFMRFFMFKP